jgi:hypothetical protein
MSVRSYVIDERGLANNFAVEPKMYLQESPRTGLRTSAQMLNGRLAMIGFVSLMLLEILTGQGLIGFIASLS